MLLNMLSHFQPCRELERAEREEREKEREARKRQERVNRCVGCGNSSACKQEVGVHCRPENA